MDIKDLNLNEDQTKGVNKYITEQITKTKEDYKDYLPKDDVNKLIEAETSKIKNTYDEKLNVAEKELKKYKPKDKSEAEIELEKRLKILEDKEKEVAKKEKVMNVSIKLKEQGLPEQLSKYLSDIEDDKLSNEIGNLKEIFTNSKIDNSFKPDSHKSKSISITKEQFKKMGIMERMDLYKNNKELYDKLSK
ncbi:hypothetical protein KM792_11140 [Clostridium tyrobutyricum]|uniref:hypothetical protein n=1 Tax=Clostridium tyrobutyricum TaxID=1519 RepID=UPI001C37F5E8|nr:hypothetical protein [Clostridium tyrobutyricum]MBV4427610.1 hypothetical protein [Clostridium tyrobutyricum]MBV4442653.1 hypothetical protein [Clostridium tyrobutyricum]MBV4450203.1 hypothetical protein [Clostridium tyrobutyricum]MEA5008765.1 hypothetical protein [Clostridium tyrobutyricum]